MKEFCVKGRVVVTGASGFVGRRLCSWLVQHDCQITALVRQAGTAPAAADREHRWSDLEAGQAQCGGLEGADTVVHCAGLAHLLGPEAIHAEQRFRQANVLLTERLALQAAKAGVRRLVFLSSIKVNGESTDGRCAFSETDQPSPSAAFARSKAEAEQRLREIGAERGLEIVIIRRPWFTVRVSQLICTGYSNWLVRECLSL